MPPSSDTSYDLAIIGTGMTGMAAALFAAGRGLSVVQIGSTGEVIFASGLIDLMGIHPMDKKRLWRDPWKAIAAVSRDLPTHPYARIREKDIATALDLFIGFLQSRGLGYFRRKNRNCDVITSTGTLKRSYGIPKTMRGGVTVFEKKEPCLLVDFHGLKSYSARQVAQTLKPVWPGIRTRRMLFPGEASRSEVYAEQMARALEVPGAVEHLAKKIKPHVKKCRSVGFPAILGIYHSDDIHRRMEKMLGARVFEIPSMPPSIPGLRIKEVFESHLPRLGVTQFLQRKVIAARHRKGSGFFLDVGVSEKEVTLRSRGVILATGRFIGGGLKARRQRVSETVFNLPVAQPRTREMWHRLDFLDSRGHPINQAGLDVDNAFRPLTSSGTPKYARLFAAGSILAHQDWVRMKCGSGLAIATAYAAVKSFIKNTS
jgi:glycerol-3-phosphate dehydrogenase subunit B